jgi:hypothetical protein
MKRFLSILLLITSTTSTFAQFTLGGADEFLQKRAEQAEQKRIKDSIQTALLEDQQLMANDVRYRMKWVNMVTYRQSIGFVQNAYNLSYSGYIDTKNEWTFPISLRLTGSKEFNENNLASGYKDWSQWATELGMFGFRKIRKEQYLALGLHVPLGWERYRYDDELPSVKKHWHGLIGIRVEERLMYLSDRKTGLVMSAGFYQLLVTSKRYDFDAGFSLEIGIKF